MADEDAPVEETPAEDAPVEDPPVEDAPAEDALEEHAGDASAPRDGGAIASEPPWRAARVAAAVAGAVLAGAAAITGAVWAISAIVVDDDYGDCCVVDYATSFDRDGLYGAPRGWEPQPDRDWDERAERRRGERFDRDRGERFDRDGGERDKRGADKEREERGGGRKAGSSEPDEADAVEGCMTILSFGTGDDAVTVLVCNAPRAAGPEFDPDGDGGYFEFRRLPRGAFPFFPFPDLKGERLPFEGRLWPFGPGMMPWDRDGRTLEDGEWPFEYGWPFGDGAVPLDRGDRLFKNLRPFDREQFEGFEGFFEDGRPFESRPFESDEFFEQFFEEFEEFEEFSGDGRTLDQLSEEEREQLEQMMEMLDGLGLGDLLGGMLDSLDGLEFEFPESQDDPTGGTGA